MGEAKRRARLRAEAAAFVKPLKRARFEIMAIGTRRSPAFFMAEELSWWASKDERLIAVVARDTTDNDYLWAILARDRIGCFRWVDGMTSLRSQWHAEEALAFAMADTVKNKDVAALGHQGDETNAPIDLLRLPTDVDPNTLHPYFRQVLESPARAPARAVIREIGPWLTPNDPHLVREFQGRSFDQRLWEIYLWAAFREFGLDVQQLEAPDFRCTAPGVDFTVEATTAAPSGMGPLAAHPDPKTKEEMTAFLADYMPMKFGSALLSKLEKKNKEGLHYWEREASRDKPFLLAIADFHKPATGKELGPMVYTQSALWRYLYGHRVDWEFIDDKLVINHHNVEQHQFGAKVIPSGFFDLPNAENVSAVIFSNAGTLAKFDRMGVVAGFGADGVRYIRAGFRADPDPNAVVGKHFVDDVTDEKYEEYWTDELQVFHNPNAKHPLPFDVLPLANHHLLQDGELKSFCAPGTVLSSYTVILVPKGTEQPLGA